MFLFRVIIWPLRGLWSILLALAGIVQLGSVLTCHPASGGPTLGIVLLLLAWMLWPVRSLGART